MWVMFWYFWTYIVVISKKLQTDEKLKRWLTSQNRNFNETNEPIVSADMTKTATYDNVAIFWQFFVFTVTQ